MLNGVLFPPGSTMVTCFVETPWLQKLPRNTRSSCWATTCGCWARLPTGSMVTPLDEIAYSVLESLDSTLLPVRFSGNCKRATGVRLSDVTTCNTGAYPVV